MSLLAYHHKELVTFLKEVRDTTPEFSFISSQAEESKLFNLIVDSKDVRIKQAKAARAIGKNASHLRKKIQPNLNNMLKAFSLQCGIKPSIQLFFRTRGSYSGGHFACCDVPENQSKSEHFICLKDLKDKIKWARQRLGIKCEGFGHTNVSHTSPFMKLEKRLEPFYKRYPTKEDFEEGGSYCRIDELHEEVANKLRKKKRCLIIGDPGCGKTTLALAIGYDFLQDNYSVYYHDASMSSDVEQLTGFIESCGKNDLVILDNAHAAFDSINNLLCDVYKHDALLLVTSRNVDSTVTQSQHPDDPREGISYVEIFKEKDAFKELYANKETIKHIINQYVGSIVPEEKIGNIDTLVDKCKADYNILRFYLQAWKSKGRTGCLSDVYEKEILEDLFTRYLKNKPYQLELLRIAALSQFEIDVDSKWIKGDLDELQKDGLVQLTGTDELVSGRYVSWIRIYHPSAADYFLKAAAFKHLHIINTIDYFSLGCIASYLKTIPQNFLRVLGQIPFVEEGSIYDNIYLNNAIYDIVCKVVEGFGLNFIVANNFNITQYLLGVIGVSVENNSNRAEKLFDIYLHRAKSMGPNVFCLRIFTSLLNMSQCTPSLWPSFSSLDFREIGERTRRGMVNFTDIMIFVIQLKKSNLQREKIADFCDELNFQRIGQEIMKKKNSWKSVTWFLHIDIAGKLSNKNIRSCLNELDYKELPKQATKSAPKACDYIFSFILCSRGVGISENKIVTFFEELDFEELGLRAREGNEDIFVLFNFICLALSAKVTGSSIRSFCSNLDFRILGKQAREKKIELEDIGGFVGVIQGAGVPNENIKIFFGALYHLLD